ncbi:MAG: hypothetical protein EHM58_18480 [Ignavibacteriae bacterium]|nr:MAG: hypothetical protein EHM58_18480 [Ignavibacteriota bacterium]
MPIQYSKNIQNEHRKLINLNGEWSFSSTDPLINTPVQVPFCYEFKGKSVCTRTFNINIENPEAYNYVLYCDGVNYNCEVSINGSFVTKHEGGFSPFSAIVQDGIIKESGNTIEVKIDNLLDYSKTLPLRNLVNYPKNYGGIYRDIYITAVPKLFVRGINVKSEIDINFNADVTNSIALTTTDLSAFGGPSTEKKFSVKTEIVDSSGNVKASSSEVNFAISENSTIQIENKLELSNPQFWSPDYPFLYTLRVIISSGTEQIDVYSSDFGVHEYSQKAGSIQFNRTDLKLKGINYVEEFMNKGIAASYADLERDVKNLKTIGCNVIKVYGRPASPYLVNLCNRYGLLILEEIPVFNVPLNIITSENFMALAENQLNEMVLNHKSNPCILGYGIGNDFNVSDQKARTYVTRMVNVSKALDFRPVYYCTRNFTHDVCREIVDLTGWNIYDTDLKKIKDLISDPKFKKERIFIGAYGKAINPGNTSGYSDPTSIESQSKYIVDLQKMIKSSSILGSFFLTYSDWTADYPNAKFFDPSNQYLRTSGLYSLNRDQRSSAIIIKKEFLDEDIPNLNIGTYSREAPIVFVLLGLFTFILFIYLANSVRRFRENVWRAFFRPFIFYSDVREQNLMPVYQNILLAIILSIGNALFFANLFYYWKDSVPFDIISSLIVSSDSLKTVFNYYVVNPVKLTLLLTAISFVKLFLIAAVIWLFSLTSRYRIGFNNIYTITVWGFLPTIILLITGIFYIRVLYENPDFVVIGLVVAAFIYLLSIYRVLKGTYIIFDTFFIKVYSYGIATILVFYGGIWLFLNSTRYISDYFRLILDFLKS